MGEHWQIWAGLKTRIARAKLDAMTRGRLKTWAETEDALDARRDAKPARRAAARSGAV